VIDADGNAVALTTTVNLGFGARVSPARPGSCSTIRWDDFSLEPGVPNAFVWSQLPERPWRRASGRCRR